MTDENDTGQDQQQDQSQGDEITFDGDLSTWPRLDRHAVQVLQEAALDEGARSRFATGEEQAAHVERSKLFAERAEAIDLNGELDPGDLDLLRDSGRGEGTTLAAEIERRASEAAAAKAEQNRVDAQTDEERTAEAEAMRFAGEQARQETEWADWVKERVAEGSFRSVRDLAREYETTPTHNIDRFWSERNDIERRALAEVDLYPPVHLDWLIEEGAK